MTKPKPDLLSQVLAEGVKLADEFLSVYESCEFPTQPSDWDLGWDRFKKRWNVPCDLYDKMVHIAFFLPGVMDGRRKPLAVNMKVTPALKGAICAAATLAQKLHPFTLEVFFIQQTVLAGNVSEADKAKLDVLAREKDILRLEAAKFLVLMFNLL